MYFTCANELKSLIARLPKTTETRVRFCVFRELVSIRENKKQSENEAHYIFAKLQLLKFHGASFFMISLKSP